MTPLIVAARNGHLPAGQAAARQRCRRGADHRAGRHRHRSGPARRQHRYCRGIAPGRRPLSAARSNSKYAEPPCPKPRVHPMLTLEIVSDIVCPWCYIGTRRLDAALAEIRRERFPSFTCRILWRPFFPQPEYAAGRGAVSAFSGKQVRQPRTGRGDFCSGSGTAGAAYGLAFAFEKIAVRANTLAAHRLIDRVQAAGGGCAAAGRAAVCRAIR